MITLRNACEAVRDHTWMRMSPAEVLIRRFGCDPAYADMVLQAAIERGLVHRNRKNTNLWRNTKAALPVLRGEQAEKHWSDDL